MIPTSSVIALAVALSSAQADSARMAQPHAAPSLMVQPWTPSPLGTTTTPSAAQPRAVEYGDWYGRRLTVHRWASYTMLPLFAAQYVLGDRILDQKTDAYAGIGNGVDPTTKRRHQFVAGGVGALFTLNTVTGLWNLYDSRRDPAGRRLRTVHALTMLAADAGFVTTGLIASRASDEGPPEARTHRNVALGSMGIATAGAALMWFRGDR